MHGSDAFKALEIPQLDSHVCRAGCKQFSSLVKRDILYRVRMTLQCAFKISCLIIPHLQDKTFVRFGFAHNIMPAKEIPSDDIPKSLFPFEFIRIVHASTHFQLALYWQVENLQSSI